MRTLGRDAFAASVVTAVLALTAVGCSDDKSGSAAPPTNVHSVAISPPASASDSAPPSTPESSPPNTGKSPAPSASGSTKASSRPPTATSSKPRSSAPAGGPDAKFQGTWYYPQRDATGALLTLTISGGSISVSMNGDGCSGKISATAYVTMTCKGDTGKGQASVSSNGQTLTITWVDTPAEQFMRTKP
ncbi:MAG: hypothetical protein HOV68_14655 [Streptomycetaceae bacterium]|nr:hypothetical protein [Streptomycetaceae bacterium]